MKRVQSICAAAAMLLSAVLQAGQGGFWLESESMSNPALWIDTDVDIHVTGMLANATLKQRFINQTGDWVEGRYVFPLPDQVAVERLEINVGDRRIIGEIRERAEAEANYRQARDSGRVAGLVERNRPSLFTVKVANIPPGAQVDVAIGFRLAVDYRYGEFTLRFPTTLVSRYTPGRASAPFKDIAGRLGVAVHDDDSALAPPVGPPGPYSPLSLQVTLEPGLLLSEVRSSFHEVHTRQAGGTWQVSLADPAGAGGRDFELVWTSQNQPGASLASFTEHLDGHEHFLLTLMPPQSFEAKRTPREVSLIIDTSGSMGGDPIEQARESLQFALGSLGPADRFNIIEFDSNANPLFESARPASLENLGAASRWVDRLRASGGTNMGPPLALAMRHEAPEGYLRQVLFVTDGLVGNERELLEQVRRTIGASRLFTVGIGHGVNSAFLREMAETGRGTHTLIGEVDQINQRMSELILQLESPVLHDIEIEWPASVQIHPASLPDLYVGQPLTVVARTKVRSGEVLIRATSNGQPWEQRLWLEDFVPGDGVAAHWGRAHVAELEAGRIGPEDPVRRAEAVLATALDYQLLSSRTSLVAVEKAPTRPRHELLRGRAVPGTAAHGREQVLRAMPATDAGSFAALVRGGVALLLVVLLLGHRRWFAEEVERS